jgi:N-sulfoglucosamine sulfohydrolase
MNALRRFLRLALFPSLALAAAAAPQRNVVLFVVDDMSLDAGCYGNKAIRTPNIDRLAADGVRFNYAFCTTASCSASRSVILSGLHNHANGQFGHQHSFHHFAAFSSVRSLPVMLAENGYRTARIGKFHVAPEEVFRFETVLPSAGGNRNAVAMAENCREFISKGGKPFFLYFCTSDPHRGGGKVRGDPLGPDAFGNNQSYEGVNEVRYDPAKVVVPPFLPDNPETRAELAQYYQAISRLDQGLGRLLDVLKETGQAGNTVVLFTGDNGMAFPGSKTTLYEPGSRLPFIVSSPDHPKGRLSNAMVSWVDFTPTILDIAGVKEVKGRLVQGEAEFSGTPANPAGKAAAKKKQAADVTYTFHGRSFLPVLAQENPPGWDEVFASHTFHEITMYYPMRVVRTREFKLILNLAHPLPFPFASDLQESATWQGVLKRGDSQFGPRRTADFIQRPRYELYDLKSDPVEARNVAGEPRFATVRAELAAKLETFQSRTADPWIVKYKYE